MNAQLLPAPNNSPLAPSNRVATWENGWNVHGFEIELPLRTPLGRWLLEEGLFSQGNDFTSMWNDSPNYVGDSTLKKMWQGVSTNRMREFKHAQVWVLAHEGLPQGVIVRTCPDRTEPLPQQWFERPVYQMNRNPTERVNVTRLGHVMAFVKKPSRGLGLVRQALEDLVMPGVEADARQCVTEGAMPVIGASDALFSLVGKITAVPVVSYLDVCQAMRADVWSVIDKAEMHPEKTFRFSPYLVPGEACPKPAPKRRMKK